MEVLMRSTKEWADTHGVHFCNNKSKVLVIGKQFSGGSDQLGGAAWRVEDKVAHMDGGK